MARALIAPVVPGAAAGPLLFILHLAKDQRAVAGTVRNRDVAMGLIAVAIAGRSELLEHLIEAPPREDVPSRASRAARSRLRPRRLPVHDVDGDLFCASGNGAGQPCFDHPGSDPMACLNPKRLGLGPGQRACEAALAIVVQN